MEDNEAARLRALGEVLREFDLDAIRVKIGEAEYELVRREAQAAGPVSYAVPAASNGAPAPATAEPPPTGSTGVAPASAKKITAPVVGVFYTAGSPGADPFVAVGDRVSAGQTVCILEAMKLMNEITSDYAGVVTRILPANGELVALGEELFWIEP
jgi:acetyl-CoA carboxylase biotin carboxyl carrier protein